MSPRIRRYQPDPAGGAMAKPLSTGPDEHICPFCERGQHGRCRDELCECCGPSA